MIKEYIALVFPDFRFGLTNMAIVSSKVRMQRKARQLLFRSHPYPQLCRNSPLALLRQWLQ